MASNMTKEALEARILELEEGLIEEAAETVDPQVQAKAESMLGFSVMDIKIALDVLKIEPTEDQMIAIEEAIIASKVEVLSNKAGRKTKAKW